MFHKFLGTQWPSNKVSVSDWRTPGSKPDSIEDSPYMWACCTLNHTQGAKHPPIGVVRKFRKVAYSSGVVLFICPRFKMTRSFPNKRKFPFNPF
ncbi:hypothetical protein AVEN_83930-1 [Araneus ventricosus]|uniref:Uncharacterized protein n=1 Tax=Araneus ventricosus TaxID=182803 RepID=A0A4Y2U652_ARAVE|nr:hypothetical protein AVEN_83930-1 [Araneus ventricosus]